MSAILVLFSGGIDSTTALYWARRRRSEVRALTFDYGQRHRLEIVLARVTARRAGVPVTRLRVDLAAVGGSALTDPKIPVPRLRRFAHSKNGPPATYVPFRNGVFLALAAAWAEAHGFDEIVTGFNIVDSPDYPDTRPEFVRAMERAINAGTKAAVTGRRLRLRAPFIRMPKSEIIRLGLSLGADYSHSISCYRNREAPCGTCAACLLRARAFRRVGIEDPLVTRLRKEGRL